MPRPMFRSPEQKNSQNQQTQFLNTRQVRQTRQLSKMEIDRLLRKPRSKKYMEAIRRLDAGGHVTNQTKVNEMLAAIREEFPELELAQVSNLLGIVSKCYLGAPYEVHSLDVAGRIVEHYKAFYKMPGELEKARSLAIHGGYEFIEVYTDCCRAVSSSGQVSVIQ